MDASGRSCPRNNLVLSESETKRVNHPHDTGKGNSDAKRKKDAVFFNLNYGKIEWNLVLFLVYDFFCFTD